MNTVQGPSDSQTPTPEDPEFFAKYSAPPGLLDWAFGPNGGTPPPRVTKPTAELNGPPAGPVDQSRPEPG